jgi:hypothetical protein
MFGAVLCVGLVKPQSRFRLPSRRWALLSSTLVIYAILMLVYVYRITGGATSVDVVDGRYVTKYKNQVIRTVTEQEYRMFPNLVTRVMSAWIGAMSVLGLAQLAQMPDDRA